MKRLACFSIGPELELGNKINCALRTQLLYGNFYVALLAQRISKTSCISFKIEAGITTDVKDYCFINLFSEVDSYKYDSPDPVFVLTDVKKKSHLQNNEYHLDSDCLNSIKEILTDHDIFKKTATYKFLCEYQQLILQNFFHEYSLNDLDHFLNSYINNFSPLFELAETSDLNIAKLCLQQTLDNQLQLLENFFKKEPLILLRQDFPNFLKNIFNKNYNMINSNNTYPINLSMNQEDGIYIAVLNHLMQYQNIDKSSWYVKTIDEKFVPVLQVYSKYLGRIICPVIKKDQQNHVRTIEYTQQKACFFDICLIKRDNKNTVGSLIKQRIVSHPSSFSTEISEELFPILQGANCVAYTFFSSILGKILNNLRDGYIALLSLHNMYYTHSSSKLEVEAILKSIIEISHEQTIQKKLLTIIASFSGFIYYTNDQSFGALLRTQLLLLPNVTKQPISN